MPTVSVVIPVYNGEKTILSTVTSVIRQTLHDIEILVIDDGSNDNTLNIVHQINDDRLKVFSFPNAGLSASRNRGINLSSSEYISFLDADDEWTQDKLESQLQALQANPQAALAYSWTQFIDEVGKPLHQGARTIWSGNVYEKILVFFFLESGSNALFRKSVFSEIGVFDESLTAAEDWDICLRIAAGHEFIAVPKVQVNYRQPANSMSSNVLNQEKETLKVLYRAFEQAPKSLQHLKRKSLANLYQYLLFKANVGHPSRTRAITAARFFWQTIFYDPTILTRRSRLMSIIGLKLLGTVLLPSNYLKRLRQQARSEQLR